LNDAVTDLRRLTQRELFQALEQVADTDHIGGAFSVSVESVRNLQLWGAEHLRLAARLEAAARCCRTIERELNSQLDTLLADGEPARKTQRVKGLAGWLNMISQRGQSPAGLPDAKSTDSATATAGSGRPHRRCGVMCSWTCSLVPRRSSGCWPWRMTRAVSPSTPPAPDAVLRALEHKQQLVSRQYRICAEALRDELGVSPGSETIRLFHDLTSAPAG
jgi:hypothetical protein